MRRMLVVSWMCLVGCSGDAGAGAFADTLIEGGPTDDAADAALLSSPLVAHEWATLTSLQGSDGLPLPGLHRDETEAEIVPGFVHTGPTALAEATHRLPAPVLYLHTEGRGRVQVALALGHGQLDAWHPWAALTPASPHAPGRAVWDLQVGGPFEAVQAVDDGVFWAPLRQVDATIVATGDVRERFVFYRALASAPQAELSLDALQVRGPGGSQLEVTNTSGAPLPAVFLLHVHAGGGSLVPLGPLAAGQSILAAPTPKEIDPEAYVAKATAAVAAQLVALGLHEDEAAAVLATWQANLFRTWGLRVLAVLPPAWVDARWPLEVTPTPAARVRAWVARVEVLTDAEEQALVAELTAGPGDDLLERLGAFAEPKLRRACGLAGGNADAAAACAALMADLQRDAP